MEKLKIVDASMGFSAYLWRVTTPEGETRIVYATDNYMACEAVGFRFSECSVVPMKLVRA